ncbi:MAG: transketolase [Betaproteobacteria bacterium]|nr:transketolase [Betaproteobacteria bacterium]
MQRKQLADAIRVLAMDAVEKANSGHPGAPMGMADMGEALWRHVLRHNPGNPDWPDRDRFVLSNGHASMLLYALLHLTGYALPMSEIENFRQLGSKTPGHPEHGVTPGVEISTGPLGQGIAAAVGMALAERLLAKEFNRPGFEIVNHHCYVFLGDGCLMEGVSHEACSLAGTLGLGKLIAMYDANEISIDGKISGWFTEDVAARFEAYGWHVVRAVEGHNAEALDAAIAQARSIVDKPSLIICYTHIGCYSPKADSSKCHGAPLGAEGIAATRAVLGWNAPPFIIPQRVLKEWDCREKGRRLQAQWDVLFAEYRQTHQKLAAEFERRMRGELPLDWQALVDAAVARVAARKESIPTRVASKNMLDVLAPLMPELLGGAADLTSSVGTFHNNAKLLEKPFKEGNYVAYGVREFAMGAMMNGIALHGGFIPYGGTFLVFSDYAKNAIRLAAFMGLRVVWILTHDSIGVGEDGPTHQPVEQLSGLRLTPGVKVWRPCDAVESAVAWKIALQTHNAPSCLILSRQNLPFVERAPEQLAAIERGGYILRDCEGVPEAIVMASGSEIQLALAAAERLTARGRRVRVVSLPSTSLFEAQDEVWREHVLPHAVRARVAVEAASVDIWGSYVGLDGCVVGMRSFGESAPASILFEHFGITIDAVESALNKSLSNVSAAGGIV